jgi:hypothetical protein
LELESEVARAVASSSAGINGTTDSRTGRVKLVSIGGLSAVEPKVVFYGGEQDTMMWLGGFESATNS